MPHPTVTEIASGLEEHGISASKMCRRADVAMSTWARWKSSATAPNSRTLDQVKAAYDQLVGEVAPDTERGAA